MFLQNSGKLRSEMDEEETELSRAMTINAEESNFDNGMQVLGRGKVHIQL